MKTRFKIALTALVLVASVGALSRFFDWMNQPSDLWFWLGVAGVLKIVVLAPAIVAVVWRPGILREWAARFGSRRTI